MSGVRNENEDYSAKDPQGPTGDLPGPRLEPGSQLGHFRIEREIGRGGAGVVYLAHDTKLDRRVAIKSLPLELMRDAQMRSRLKREARLLASLDHPNIATIHDIVEQAESGGYLILEYIEGDTLAERLSRTPLDLGEALSLAQQIAEAMAAAHEHGVTHRDLKPGNIKITPEGKVKVLDFGLAKAVASEAADQGSTITEPGRVMGTPAYMSPEQARGMQTDRRCDIWSFGCVLYEMLTGKVPFEGATASDTLAGILEREPNWSALPQAAPANIRVLLRRCLEKDPSRRLRDIGDAAIEIREALTGPPTASVDSRPSRLALWKVAALYGSVGLILAAMAVLVAERQPPQPQEPKNVLCAVIPLEPNDSVVPDPDPTRGSAALRLTPDGRDLIYVAGAAPNTWLVRRPLDSLDGRAQRIPGTEGARCPQVSPDGQWLAFIGKPDAAIYKIPLAGGKAERISSSFGGGSVWEDENHLILGTKQAALDGLSRFDLRTGKSETLTTFKDTPEYTAWHWPIGCHPESRTLLFVAVGVFGPEHFGLFALSLESRQVKYVTKGFFGGYTPSGHLIYTQPGCLMAVPFDIRTLQRTGQAFEVTRERMATSEMLASFTFSRDGTLVYIPLAGTRVLSRRLVWVDLKGEEKALDVDPMPYECVRISGDIARPQIAAAASGSIYVYDANGPNRRRLTLSADGACGIPIWLPPDNSEIVFSSQEPPDRWLIKRKAADGSGETTGLPVKLKPSDRWLGFLPALCTPDGRVLLAAAYPPQKGEAKWDVVRIHLDRDGEIEYLPELKGSGITPAFSPDGKWNAYADEEQGRYEVFVAAWPDAKKGKWQITTTGGVEPVWAPDGKTLYYRNGTSFVAVPVSMEADGVPRAGRPEVLFGDVYVQPDTIRTYDIHPDGKQFLMIKSAEKQPPITELVVVGNWFEELKRRAPVSSNQ